MARVPNKTPDGDTCVIYMNHHVHEKNATEPMITIERSNGMKIYCNDLRIEGTCAVRTMRKGDNPQITSHVVKAWIECEFENVEVIS